MTQTEKLSQLAREGARKRSMNINDNDRTAGGRGGVRQTGARVGGASSKSWSHPRIAGIPGSCYVVCSSSVRLGSSGWSGLVGSGGLVVISAHLKYALWRIRWAIYVCLASTDPHTWIYLAALLHTISYYRVLYTRICRLLVGQLCGCCRRSSVAWSGEQAEHVCMPHGLPACLPACHLDWSCMRTWK